jgi:hypothetical protein
VYSRVSKGRRKEKWKGGVREELGREGERGRQRERQRERQKGERGGKSR